jgi:hypothetical protein
MDYKRRQNRRWFRKTVILLVFGLFTAQAQAQILGLGAPIITVQPIGTNVQNGDTVTLTTSAYCTLGDICAVTWVFNNGKDGELPTNAVVSISGVGTTTVSSSLTLNHASSACAGTYYVEIEDELLGGLLGITTATATSQNATLGVIIPVTAVTTQTGMVNNNSAFKVQFSGPTGSNLVIQATSDMKSWTSLSTNVIVNGSVTYTDAVAPTASCRFYRAKLQ